MIPLTCAILAGGHSRRLGIDKALVEIGGLPLLARVLRAAARLRPAQMLLITGQPASYYAAVWPHVALEVTLLPDDQPHMGALGGLITALQHSPTEVVVVLACDMPFIHSGLLAHMGVGATTRPVVPRQHGQMQPFHACYPRAAAGPLHQMFAAGCRSVTTAVAALNPQYVDEAGWRPDDPQGLAFWNINTPDDLTAARHIAATLPAD